MMDKSALYLTISYCARGIDTRPNIARNFFFKIKHHLHRDAYYREQRASKRLKTIILYDNDDRVYGSLYNIMSRTLAAGRNKIPNIYRYSPIPTHIYKGARSGGQVSRQLGIYIYIGGKG